MLLRESSGGEMKRKVTSDWLQVGLRILGEVGDSGLTIEKMTDELGVTKGSFYHHFKNMHDFKEQLVTHWENQYISTADSVTEDPMELQALLDMIMENVYGSITKPEIAIRNWAQQDEMVRPFVERVDSVRRKFVLHVFRSITQNEDKALIMADILSTITIGSMALLPRIPPDRVIQLYKEFKRLYGLGDKSGEDE